jgi:chemotaxis protein CheZ
MELAERDDPTGIRSAIRAELAPMFDELRRFVDRRIAELSMEVSGAVQIVDYTEANIMGQLARVHDQVASLIANPATSTRNSGLELEAVVQATEDAASQIMEAAEAISDWVRANNIDAAAMRHVDDRINSIFEACSFQDLTGQRIRRAIMNLQQVETMLGGIVDHTATAAPEVPIEQHMPPVSGPELAQLDIDRMLNE